MEKLTETFVNPKFVRKPNESLSYFRQRRLLGQPVTADPQIGQVRGEDGDLLLSQAVRADFEDHVGCYVNGKLPIKRYSGEEANVVNNGRHACAYFITDRMHHWHLLPVWDVWVDNLPILFSKNDLTTIDPEERGGYNLPFVIYERFDGTPHVAVYMGRDQVISTARHPHDPEGTRGVRKHHWLYEGREDGPRQVASMWIHPLLQA